MDAQIANAPAEKAGLKEWIGLAVLALPSLLVSIDVSVMILALPHVGASLGADSAQQLWIMDVYGFMLAGFMITMGTLGDRIGRRKLLLIGGGAFGLASILAAFAPTAELLIVARALLGVAGATIGPSILALITNMFRDPGQRGIAISLWMVTFMGGMTVGPLVGGAMLQHFWWGSVFLLGVPAMVLLLVTGPFLLPEFRDEKAGRIDLPSVFLSLGAILPAIYGLKEIAKHGPDQVSILALVVGLAVGIAFIGRQRTLADPLFDLRLFGNRAFTAAVVCMFGITITGSIMLFASQYFQLVLGLSPLEAGLWTLPGVAASVVALIVAPMLAKHVRPANLIAAGLLISVAGAVITAQATAETGLAAVVIGFILFNMGCAPMITLGNGIVVGSVQPEKVGSAAALSETSAEFGFALGIAALGSIGTAIYRTAIDGSIPAGLSSGAAETVRDTLAGAVAVAQTLPGEVGTALLAAAREAFMSGMHVALWVSGISLLTVAVIAFVAFRHLKPFGGTPSAHGDAETVEEVGSPALAPAAAN